MKQFRLLFYASLLAFISIDLKAQVTIGLLENPDTSALLDLKNQSDSSSDKGFLLPRVAITNSTQFGLAGNSLTEGMMVYNTIANTNNSGKGLYYWDGNNWIYLQGTDSRLNWLVNGNTNGTIKTLGTQDSFDLPLITNNVERMRITSSGNVGIGTTTPKARFSVSGGAISQDDYTDGDKFLLQGYTTASKISLNTNSNLSFYAGSLTQSDGTTLANANSGYYTWNVADISNTWREVMHLTNDGKLGIGTDNPQATLHAAGSAQIDNTLTIKTLLGLTPIVRGLVADNNGLVKRTSTTVTQRYSFSFNNLASGTSGTQIHPNNTDFCLVTVTTTNGCGDVAVANFNFYKNVLIFNGGRAKDSEYSFTSNPVRNGGILTTTPTVCSGPANQFNFFIQASGNTITITNNGSTTMSYQYSVVEY